MVKNPPASAGDVRDTGSLLGQEDPLEEGMATYSNILTWRIPWGLSSPNVNDVTPALPEQPSHTSHFQPGKFKKGCITQIIKVAEVILPGEREGTGQLVCSKPVFPFLFQRRLLHINKFH